MSGKWEENLRKVTPYTPGEQSRCQSIVKLNTNENPYPPAPQVRSALAAMEADSLRLYPELDSGGLTSALADNFGVDYDQVVVGVGSDDILSMCFLAFFNSSRPVLFPDVTYSFYRVWAELYHVPYETPPLDENFRICPEDYDRENGGIIFPNPNAPTGVEMSGGDIEYILEHNQDSVVIIDEAYIDFGGHSVIPLIDKYENLLVVQTFSKSRALAGVRIGYAIGSRRLIRELKDVKSSINSYSVNRISQAVGEASLKNPDYHRLVTDKIISTREEAAQKLTDLGFVCTDSRANFLFVTHPEWKASELYQTLKDQNILVRYFNTPRIDNYLRITVGTDSQMERLYQVLGSFHPETSRKGD